MNRMLSNKISLTALSCALGASWLAAAPAAYAQTGVPASLLSGSSLPRVSALVVLDPDSDLADGVAKYKAGDFAGAIEAFNRSIKARPVYPDAYFDRGLAYGDSKQYDKAIADFTKYIGYRPKVADGYLERARNYSAAKQAPAAIADYAKVLELKPNTTDVYTSRGDMYFNTGDFDKAIADYTAYFRLAGTQANPVVYNNRALAYLSKKPADNASAIADYNLYIAAKPTDGDAFLSRGDAYFSMKQYDKAAADYGSVIRLKPNEAGGYSGRASAYLLMTPPKTTEAIADYKAYIAKNPSDPAGLADAYKNLGLAYFKSSDYPNAIAAYTKFLAMKPGDKTALSNRAQAYIAMKDFASANADYSAFIAANPNDPTAYFNRAVGYSNQKVWDKAAADFTKYLSMKPGDADGYKGRATAYVQLSRYAEAAKDYSAVLASNPGDLQSLYNRGVVYYKNNDLALAQTDLTAYDAKKPGDANVAEILAAIAVKGGTPGGGIAALKRLADLKPTDEIAQFNYGVALYNNKDYPTAITVLSKAVTLNPRDEVALYTRALANVASANDKTGDALKAPLLTKAVADCAAALVIKPDYKEALLTKGDAEFALKLYPAAIADYKRYLAMPGNAGDKATQANLAAAYINSKDMAGAEEAVKSQVAADPTNPVPLKNLAIIQLTAKPPKLAEAQATLTKLISLSPSDSEAYSNRGYTYFAMTPPDNAKASADYEKAFTLKADYTTAYQAGLAYNKIADADAKADTSEAGVKKAAAEYDKAIAWFDKANGVKPSADAFYNKGVAYEKKASITADDEQYKGAITAFERYIATAPASDPDVPKVKSHITDLKAKIGG